MNPIHALIRDEYGGHVPFEQFMDLALHHPEHGYYRRRGAILGRCGDFTTAPIVSCLPGMAVARWCCEVKRGGSPASTIIEVGAGDGAMAAALLDALGWFGRLRFRLVIVESSPELQEKQRKRLGKRARDVVWHSTMESALAGCGDVLVYHNELVDAFPCALLEYRDGVWQEVWVEVDERGLLREVLRPLRQDLFQGWEHVALGWSPPIDGQRVEIHASYFQWLNRWLPFCHSLEMLTVDYGSRFPDLYRKRPRGTLRAYLRHLGAGATSPLDHAGRQDITADVNVTDLENIGKSLGLEVVSMSSLSDFLRKVPAVRPSATDARLLDPDDAGGSFFVLHQRLMRSRM